MKETLIQNAPLFSSLSGDEAIVLASVMREMAFAKGEVLLAQGQPADRMYLIQSGWVKQTTNVEGGRTLINNLGSGSMVGEMDILLDQAATSSVQTNSDVVLWALSQSDISRILDDHPRIGLKISAALGTRIRQVDQYLVNRRLRSMPLFADLDAEQLNALAERLKPLEIRRGGLIYRAGGAGEALFIVEEGQVLLTSAADQTGNPHSQLGPGETLGEMSLLTGKPYDGVARASSDVVLWVLRREDFADVTRRFPSVRVALSSRFSGPLGADDRQAAQNLLSKLPLFAGVPSDVLAAVAGVLVLRHYPAGERVFNIGDPGNSLLVVESGGLKLGNADGAARWLKPGEQVGHNSLLTGKSRADWAIAEQDTNLWMLFASDFEALLARFPALGMSLGKAVTDYLESSDRLFLNSHLRASPLFAGLSDVELSDIAQLLRPVKLTRGEVIFAEGEQGDAMYFVETGEVQLATRLGEGYQLAFDRLGAGGFFGELALLSDAPRKSSARAVSDDTHLWALDKADFDRLAIKHPQLALTISKMMGERLARADAAPVPARRIAPPSQNTALRATAVLPTVRPLKAKPSSVTPPKRQEAAARPTAMRAVPLTLKPAAKGGMPQARPVPARPASPRSARAAPAAAVNRPMPVAGIGGMARAAVPVRSSLAARSPVPARPGVRTPAIRSTGSRMPVVRRQSDPVALALAGGVNWMLARPLGFKFRLAAVTMLFVWLCGIAAPVTAISALALSGNAAAVAPFTGISVNIGDPAGQPGPAVLALAGTFTPTPRPTNLPTAVPTATPVPPTATPVPERPTATARPVFRAEPTATPTAGGPVVANAPVAAVDFKVDSVRRLTACENQGNHNLYYVVQDQNGKGMPGIEIQVVWDSGRSTVRTGNKVENIPWLGVNSQTTSGFADFVMYRGRYKSKIMNYASEETDWLTVDIGASEYCSRNDNPQGNSLFHYSYLIVFKKIR